MSQRQVSFSQFADIHDELEVFWIAGKHEVADGTAVRVAATNRETGHLVIKTLPMAAAVYLTPGACLKNGRLLQLSRQTPLQTLHLESLAMGVQVDASTLPRNLWDFHGHFGWGQKLLRYDSGGWTFLVPTIELIRFLFFKSRAVANAIFEPAGLMNLAIAPAPGFHPVLHIDFTQRMPVRSLNDYLVREIAWISCDPIARRAWDSVQIKCRNEHYFDLDPPDIAGNFVARTKKYKDLVFIQKIMRIDGRTLPCSELTYSHPSIQGGQVRFTDRELELERQANRSSGIAVVDPEFDDSDSSKRDTHQPATLALHETSPFDQPVRVRVIPIDTLEPHDPLTERTGRDKRSELARSTSDDEPNSTATQRLKRRYGLGAEVEGAHAQPIEFKLLENAPIIAAGESAYFVKAIERMSAFIPGLQVSVGFCFLAVGKKISRVPKGRRGCTVGILERKARPPIVLIDVDHQKLRALSALALRFHQAADLEKIETTVQAIINDLVGRGDRWNPDLQGEFADTCHIERLRAVMRVKHQVDDSYIESWADYLIQRLFG